MKIKILMTILTAILVLTTAFMVSASTNVVVTEDDILGGVMSNNINENDLKNANLYLDYSLTLNPGHVKSNLLKKQISPFLNGMSLYYSKWRYF